MKRLVSAACFILILLTLVAPVIAQPEKIMMFPPDGGSPANLFGQNHWYTVVFRGNGEAVVNSRITFTNSDATAMKTITFRVPRVEPTDIIAYQIIRQGQCVQYDQTREDIRMPNPPCLQYEEPDMYNWYGPSNYQKAEIQYAGDTITVSFPQSVPPEKSGSIMLYFRAFGYAKKDIVGGRTFTFETLKASQPVNELQVGINTDSDLILRGAKSEVNYRFEDSQMAMKGMAEFAAPAPNSRMDSYIQQMGYGTIVKKASNLQAFESYTVLGSYADSRIKLYAKEIGIGLFSIILFAALGSVLVRRMFQTKQTTQPTTLVLTIFGLSFISAIITIGYSAIIIFVVQNMSQFFGYQTQAPIMLLLLIISLGVYGLTLGAPALFIGMKRGLWYGVATACLTILWLILTLLLYLILNMSRQNPNIYPMRMMKTLENSVSAPSLQ